MNKQTIVIGLDGVSKNLIEALIKKKKIPNIEKIIKAGSLKEVKSVIPPNSVPAWSCIVSGSNPGEIGLFGCHTVKDYAKVPVKHYNFVPFWEKVDARCGIINVPGTYPARPFNGFILTGVYTPSMDSDSFIYPKEIREMIKEELPKYQLTYNWNSMNELIQQIRSATEVRFKVVKKLLKELKPDVVVVVENGTDAVQHLMARYVYHDSPIYEENEEYEKAFYDYYELVDHEVGKLVTGHDGEIIILSDHGGGALHGKFHLNEWLVRNDFLKLKKNSTFISSVLSTLKLDSNKIDTLLMKFKIKKLAYALLKGTNVSRLIPSEVGALQWNDAVNKKLIDWENTVAFAMENGVYINTSDFKAGSVAKEDFERVRNKVYEVLQREQGWCFKHEVKKKEEVYRGKHLDQAPDLLFYDTDFRFWPSSLLKTKEIFTPTQRHAERCGNHRLQGMVISSFPIEDQDATIYFLYNYLLKKYGVKEDGGKEYSTSESLKKQQ